LKKDTHLYFLTAVCMLAAFVAWTIAVRFVDIRAIGPEGSSVGFAAVNLFFHNMTGVHMSLYILTDWLGLVPVGFAAAFALLGLIQWIQRKSLLNVDRSILILGIFYIAVIAAYLFFEKYVVNYRPVLIEGYLEASYPSSTTLLVMCVMPTAAMQLNRRIKNACFRNISGLIISVFAAFMVIARLISGVHWLTDIIGGAFLSAALVMMYYSLARKTQL